MRYYQHSRKGTVPAVIIMAVVTVDYPRLAILAALLVCTLTIASLIVKLHAKLIKRTRNNTLQDVDQMTGLEFEHYVVNLLVKSGFTNPTITEQYDLGVDIVAEKDGVRWGIQAKRYSGLVKELAVRQVVTALNPYSCDRSMIITNSYYSEIAKTLSQSNKCILVNRNDLAQWIAS